MIINDILIDVSMALLQPVVSTTFPAPIVAGLRTITPPSMIAIYLGAQIICGLAGSSLELVSVSSVSADGLSFTATFAQAHAAGEPIFGATFPKGQPLNPLFTQAEMLGYAARIQNDFLVSIHTCYSTAPVVTLSDQMYYDKPGDCHTIVRESNNSKTMFRVSQSELDLADYRWQQHTDSNGPDSWFTDRVSTEQFGVTPVPTVGGSISLWYAQRGPAAVLLTDPLLLPRIFSHYVKYGILEHCFSKDGEMRDPSRSEYCNRRFGFGVMLAQLFLGISKNTPDGQAPSVEKARKFTLPTQVQETP